MNFIINYIYIKIFLFIKIFIFIYILQIHFNANLIYI